MSDYPTRRAPFAAAMGCTQSSESARNVPVTSSTGGTHYPNFEIPRPFDMNPPPTTCARSRSDPSRISIAPALVLASTTSPHPTFSSLPLFDVAAKRSS